MSLNNCQWLIDGSEPCVNPCEGKNALCATHSRLSRKLVSDAQKQVEKRKAILSQPTAPRAKPNKVSAKRKEQNVEYFKLVEQFKKDNPECKAKVNEYCTGTTDDPHHSKGRGKYLLDIDTWIPCCRSCHTWIHDNTSEAKEKGLIFSRLATVKQTV